MGPITHDTSIIAGSEESNTETRDSPAHKETNDDSDDDFGGVEAMRCLFDLNMPTADLAIPLQSGQTLQLVTAEDQELGALQSGIALWPAGKGLCDFVIDALENEMPNSIFETKPKTILELGAGCGLAGLGVALKLREKLGEAEKPATQLQVVITERDQKLLTMIEQSIELNELEDCASVCAHEWGNDGVSIDWAASDQNNLDTVLVGLQPDDIDANKEKGDGNLDLVLGADLIYSSKAVTDLFATIRHLFDKHGAPDCRFVLGSSFRHVHSTELLVKFCCEYGISRHVEKDELGDGGLLVEVFAKAPVSVKC